MPPTTNKDNTRLVSETGKEFVSLDDIFVEKEINQNQAQETPFDKKEEANNSEGATPIQGQENQLLHSSYNSS